MIKAIFFDIDGTLVSFKTHKIPESTILTLNRLRENGIKLFIATGRSWRQLKEVEGLPHFDGYITLTGSCCLTGNGEVIYKNCIPQQDMESLAEFHKNRPFPVEFVYMNRETMSETSEEIEKIWALVNMPVPPVVSMEDSNKSDVYQLGLFLSREEEAELQIVERIMPGCVSLRWSPHFFDAVPKGSSKSIGIDKMIEYYGIDLAETMAFGDGGNDIDMLRHVGLGVAMGNAGEEVKSAAKYVTTSVDEDGIMNAIYELGILKKLTSE